jgi:hypothetical protein
VEIASVGQRRRRVPLDVFGESRQDRGTARGT